MSDISKKKKIIPIIKDTYLAVVKNSVGSNLFRNFYVTIDGVKTDDTRDGDLSCAFFVSSILALLDLIKGVHLTVDGTVRDLKASGWKEVKKHEVGDVLVWEAKVGESGETHKHIGFFIGNDRAISNDSTLRHPAEHHWTFDGTRKINLVFRKDM